MMCLVVVDVAVAPNGGGKGRPTLLFSLRSVYSVSVADIIFFNMMTKLEAALLLQRFTWDYVCAMYLVLGMVCR